MPPSRKLLIFVMSLMVILLLMVTVSLASSEGLRWVIFSSLGINIQKALNCSVLGKEGKPVTLMMGCYGIGVSRIIAAAIEQNHDDNGIIWAEPEDKADSIALLCCHQNR